MEAFIKAAQLIVSLSILVIVHEFGHFLFAKLFKTRVEKFYLFFDPWFSLFKIKKGETEYGIGWLPLGGYVKISGMIDESMDREQMKRPQEAWEFRSKPAWQRFFIMIGGVMFNMILAMLIYIFVLFSWGEEYLPVANMKYGIYCDSTALELGFQHGDKIVSLDNNKVENFSNILMTMILDNVKSVQIKRGEQNISIPVEKNILADINEKKSYFIKPAIPFIVDGFSENSNAKKAGIQVGDVLHGINNEKLKYFDQYPPVLAKHKGKEVVLLVERNGSMIDIPSMVSDEGMIGVQVKTQDLFELKTTKYSFLEAIPKGLEKGYNEIGNYLKQLKLIANPETKAYKSVGSFIAIGNIFPPMWDWYAFWMMTALLSIMLGVINILPIPALDGGHLLFLVYEMVVGKKPGDKFMEYAQLAGMFLLLALMVFAIGNDFANFVFN